MSAGNTETNDSKEGIISDSIDYDIPGPIDNKSNNDNNQCIPTLEQIGIFFVVLCIIFIKSYIYTNIYKH